MSDIFGTSIPSASEAKAVQHSSSAESLRSIGKKVGESIFSACKSGYTSADLHFLLSLDIDSIVIFYTSLNQKGYRVNVVLNIDSQAAEKYRLATDGKILNSTDTAGSQFTTSGHQNSSFIVYW